jgi:hypothetical protein
MDVEPAESGMADAKAEVEEAMWDRPLREGDERGEEVEGSDDEVETMGPSRRRRPHRSDKASRPPRRRR